MKIQKQKGFTLIEFLIYAGIIAFAMTAIVMTGINVLFARVRVKAMEQVSHNARFAMENITHSIRNAESIEEVSGDSLVLEVSSSKDNPTEYTINSNDQIVVIKGGSESILTTEEVSVKSIDFDSLSEKAVRIEMVVEFHNPQDLQEYEFQRTYRTIENVRK